MYLARIPEARGARFMVRHSYLQDDVWCSRDLADLGPDPGLSIVYPGGNAFYPDPSLVDRITETLAAQGDRNTDVGDTLEHLLWAFVRPEVRRAVGGFYQRAERNQKPAKACDQSQMRGLPLFDRRRILFLRSGQMDQTTIDRVPPKLFNVLLGKSRDEIEQMLIAFEDDLNAREIKSYVFTIFDLQRFFQSPIAKAFPQVLPTEKVDAHFLEQLCGLNQDPDVWLGQPRTDGLQAYLQRYVIMYFDHVYPEEDFNRRYMDDFRRRHRHARAVRPALNAKPGEYITLFGYSRKVLLAMDKPQLRKLYRKMAIRHHPDQGGQPQAFVRLTQVYQDLMHRNRPAQ